MAGQAACASDDVYNSRLTRIYSLQPPPGATIVATFSFKNCHKRLINNRANAPTVKWVIRLLGSQNRFACDGADEWNQQVLSDYARKRAEFLPPKTL